MFVKYIGRPTHATIHTQTYYQEMDIWSFKPTNIEIKPWLKPHIQMIYLKRLPWYQHLTGFNHNPLFLLNHQTNPIVSYVTNYFILCIQEEYNAPEIGPWHTIVQCRVMDMRIGVRCTSHESWIITQTNLATLGKMKLLREGEYPWLYIYDKKCNIKSQVHKTTMK